MASIIKKKKEVSVKEHLKTKCRIYSFFSCFKILYAILRVAHSLILRMAWVFMTSNLVLIRSAKQDCLWPSKS